MILELDCGNSFIKWRVLEVDGSLAFAEGVVSSDAALIDGLIALPGLLLARCRLVSVRAPSSKNGKSRRIIKGTASRSGRLWDMTADCGERSVS